MSRHVLRLRKSAKKLWQLMNSGFGPAKREEIGTIPITTYRILLRIWKIEKFTPC